MMLRIAATVSLVIAAGATPLAAQAARDLFYIPAGYPQSGPVLNLNVDDQARTRFCSAGLAGLELARKSLGFSGCDSDAVSAEVLQGESGIAVDGLLLVDDTQGLDQVARDLLGRSVSSPGGTPTVMPFALQLSQSMTVGASGHTLPQGYRMLVVGEQLYRDRQAQGWSAERWLQTIRSEVSVAATGPGIPGNTTVTPQVARNYLAQAISEHENGNHAESYRLMSDLYRTSNACGTGSAGTPTCFDTQYFEYLEFNLAHELYDQGLAAYEEGGYRRALEFFEAAEGSPMLPSQGSTSLRWNIARCYLRLDDIDTGFNRYPAAMSQVLFKEASDAYDSSNYQRAADLFGMLYEDPRSTGAGNPDMRWNQGLALFNIPSRQADGQQIMADSVSSTLEQGIRSASMPNYDAMIRSFDAMPQGADELLGPLRTP